ncbi:transposase, partial [Kocuria rosea]|uniref:transposase n=1 Tax=Kocuria rosea TaxID=1275 RepID=UPI00232D9A95
STTSSATNTEPPTRSNSPLDEQKGVKGYDYPRCRRYLHRRGIKVRIARRGIEAKTHLGRHRWVVERTISWVLRFKRLGIRYDRTAATLLPLLLLAVTLINFRRLRQVEEL